MKFFNGSMWRRTLTGAFSGVLFASACLGATVYTVTLDTTALVGHPAGPFALNFQLIDGEGTGDANNTITLSNFFFGGGSATGSPDLVNGASGSLGTTVLLTDVAFFNAFTQTFTVGSQLSFLLRYTTNVDPGGTPDRFSFAILDSTGFEIPTLYPSYALLVLDIDSELAVPQGFATDPNLSPNGGGNPIVLGPPILDAGVPEPGSGGMLLGGLLAVIAFTKSRAGYHRG